MSPPEAADEIFDMFALCADEDLTCDITGDLQLDPAKAELIAVEIRKRRAAIGAGEPGRF